MVNSMLIFGPIGMIFVGFVAIFYWMKSRRVKAKYFFLGGVLWALAISPKLAMDLTVTPQSPTFSQRFFQTFGVKIP